MRDTNGGAYLVTWVRRNGEGELVDGDSRAFRYGDGGMEKGDALIFAREEYVRLVNRGAYSASVSEVLDSTDYF